MISTETITSEDLAVAEKLALIRPANRMLLLPHCLRPSQGCPGRMTAEGLDCSGCTRDDCKVGLIAAAARTAGYAAVCVAPGGRLAVRRVAAIRPEAIVAVACDKELEEGVAAVGLLPRQTAIPLIVQVPLVRDGCVETDVDLERVIAMIEV